MSARNLNIDLSPLTVGKLADAAGVSSNAVRFYEKEGLMPVPARTESGYRTYDPGCVERLRFIKHAQRCGFTLTEVKALLRLRDEQLSCCDDVRNKVIEKKLELEARIKAMKEMSRALDGLITDCHNGSQRTKDCTILHALSEPTKKPPTTPQAKETH